MTKYEQSMLALREQCARNAQLERELRAAYHDLGLRPGVAVANADTAARRIEELSRPYVALILRHGNPHDYSYVVAADSLEALYAMVPRARSGPNGPIDGVEILRSPTGA